MDPLSLSIRDTVSAPVLARGKNVHATRAHRWNRARALPDGTRILNNGLRFFGRRTLSRDRGSCYGAYISRPTHKFIAGLISANKTERAAATRAVFERTSPESAVRPVSRYNRHFSSDPADSSRSAVRFHARRATSVTCPISRHGSHSVVVSGRQTRFSYPPFKPLGTRDLGERASITRER